MILASAAAAEPRIEFHVHTQHGDWLNVTLELDFATGAWGSAG
jgi:hypothetical protein